MTSTLQASRWIISDIDGCLAPEESVAWDRDLFAELACISQHASQGLGPVAPLTLCSGRPQPYVEVLMKLLDVRAPAICESGAVLYSLHDNTSVLGPGVTPGKIQGLRVVRGFIEKEILPRHPEAVVQFGKEAHVSVFSKRPEIFPDIRSRVEAFVAENGLPRLEIQPSHYYLNISLDGVDKGSALRVLLEELGIDGSQAVGIGDTEGDLPLRECVGFFACPANSVRAIKDAADYVSPYPNLAGLLDILRQPACRLDYRPPSEPAS
ncbi:HAD hydrolase family protein [Candidatus Sumerlaeota bacterium]|nr:HAD hydrolase family protein [Candidatus Sumerlaeota bacterium]